MVNGSAGWNVNATNLHVGAAVNVEPKWPARPAALMLNLKRPESRP